MGVLRIARRPHQLPESFHGIVTVSAVMHDLFGLIQRVARTDSTVLIRGETGTGKELVAKALHALSPRADGPFRAVNCATFTPELLASELFGHVRGAFTGAVRDRKGLFALTDGGTLFLDEIAELPLGLQSRLLRVIQDKTFIPVGGTESVKVDIRLITATHRSLRSAVEERRFRADLMYRIRVVPLHLPPLRERRGDVEALAWYFIDEFNQAMPSRKVESINCPALTAMLAHDWAGNVRELRNVIEYAFAVGISSVIGLADLPPELRGEEPAEDDRDGPTNLRGLERRHILRALDQSNGRKGRAAELLGMSRSTLWRKMREHAIT